MAYLQRSTPPPNKILSFHLNNFAGGLNNRSHLLESNQCSDVMNMSFMEDEIMERRKGQVIEEAGIASAILFMDTYRPYTGSDMRVKAINDAFYVNGSFVRSVSGQIQGLNVDGKYFFTDQNNLYVYGIFPQVTSTYEVITGTPMASNIPMRIITPPAGMYTPLGTTHKQGITYYDYTNQTICYMPCQLELNDSYKGANVLPEKVKFMVLHQGRVFASGSNKDDDNVFITDVRNPYYFPVALPIQLPPNSDMVRGMSVYDNSVLVGRKGDIYAIDGTTNNPDLGLRLFELRKLNTHAGFMNNMSINVAHNFLFFLGSDGVVYSLSSANQNEKIVSTTILSRTLDLFSSPLSLTRDNMLTACSVFYQDEWLLSIDDTVLVYNYRHRAWTRYNGFRARSFLVSEDKLLWGNQFGQVVKFADDYLDFDEPYESYWTSKNFDMEDPATFKQFKEFFLQTHTYDEYKSTIRIEVELDYVNVNSRMDVTNQVSKWGVAHFGDRFITRNINASIPITVGRRARNIRFTFRSGYISGFTCNTRTLLDLFTDNNEGKLVLVTDENQYYVYKEGEWTLISKEDTHSPMRIYQINGEYELRGKR